MKQNSFYLILSFGLIYVTKVQCLTLEQVEILVKNQVEDLTKSLQNDVSNLIAENEILRLERSHSRSTLTQDECPCDLALIELLLVGMYQFFPKHIKKTCKFFKPTS
jgi:hypothetical protein